MNNIHKKRGRKPKGGKIVDSKVDSNTIMKVKKNIIVHLKCYTQDLHKQSFLSEMLYQPKVENVIPYQNSNTIYSKFDDKHNSKQNTNTNVNDKENIINDKLKQLEKQFYHNIISTKKSACFWCTYHFENNAVYIPKHKIHNIYEVYGCFCCPECAVGYLYSEKIDTSAKWERYSLLNSIYSKIYNYERNIIPAPEPRYTLSKFFGNMNIEEYRKINTNNPNSIILLHKPITRILPELFVSNDMINIHNRIFEKENKSNIDKYKLYRNNNSKMQSNEVCEYWQQLK